MYVKRHYSEIIIIHKRKFAVDFVMQLMSLQIWYDKVHTCCQTVRFLIFTNILIKKEDNNPNFNFQPKIENFNY